MILIFSILISRESWTYDESGTLFAICLRKMKHGVDDLDAGVGVDIDGLGIGVTKKKGSDLPIER